ncbi:MAG: glycerophosphodiester phosphodiesterase [bacterium]|nr:glycerophosphodiester phosphodiesterase [bacterium]
MQPLIIYHRGRHGNVTGKIIPENSLEAFELAIQEGADMIEFDVQTGLKIAHDPAKESVPTLSEVLDLVGGRCAINVEIKSPSAAYDTIKLIREALSTSRWKAELIILSSFHHETAIFCKKSLPQLKVGAINDGVLLTPYIELLKKEGIDNLHIDWANVYMDLEAGSTMLSTARKNKMQIWVWTVNSIEVFKKVKDYGVQAIFTDRPELMRNLTRS